MAVEPFNFKTTGSRTPSKTMHPLNRGASRGVQQITLAPIAGAPILVHTTPLAYNTSTNKWVVWTDGGADGTGTIKGFLWMDVQTHATNDVIGTAMVYGHINIADIALPAGEDAADLLAACTTGLRELGLHVTGIANWR